jgi:hypothetical protein
MTTVTIDRFQIRRSSTPGYRPPSLADGEQFINDADKIVRVGKEDGFTEYAVNSDADKLELGQPIGDAVDAAKKVTLPGTGAVTRPVYASVREHGIPLTAFGVSDSGEISAAWTKALIARANVLANYGRSERIFLPAGTFTASQTLTYDDATATEPGAVHCDFRGAGSGLTTVAWLGSGNFFAYRGGTVNDQSHSLLKLHGMQVLNNGAPGSVAFSVYRSAFGKFDDLLSVGFDLHCDLIDVLSSKWDSCRMTFGRRGIWARRGTFSFPNALNFVSCVIANMDEWAGVIDGGSAFNFLGGSIENNGIPTTYPSRGGLAFLAPGNEGQIAGSIIGTYFENNGGVAHVSLDHTGALYPTLLYVASSFNMIDAGVVPLYTISATSGANDPTAIINVAGSSFGHRGSYVPALAHPYIGATGQARIAGAGGAQYHSNTQRPRGVYHAFASSIADCRVASPVDLYPNNFLSNIASITKNAPGDLTWTFRARGVAPYNVTACYLTPGFLPPVVFSEDANSIRLQFYKTDGTTADPYVRLWIE